MRKHNKSNSIKSIGRRGAAWLLALALMCGLMPGAGLSALAVQAPGTGNQAEYGHWAQEYLDKLVSWGVMRGDIDGNLRPDADISRAEFVTMVNRAYGYDEVGVNPFTDVDFHSWYADDISIAYNVGYFTGTSSTTASPDLGLTREQATLLLGRNMMLEASTGETLGYADSREFSDWSRAMIPAASNAGIINGYSDGTFRPQNNITRGEVAAMLARSLGTPIYEAGEYELGNVYGNVTIATSGVNLRNTVIAGDLYLTGGIGLGELLLENVTVLGRIIASGAGESNKGDSSIILRNVEADSMVVDSINNQFVTLRVEGDTDIDVTSVRTPAYLEDVTPDEYGLKLVQLEGEAGTSLQLAGNVKEVVNLTPNSYLHMAQGSAQRVTIDEKAMGATMQIDLGARVKELNLDVATTVTGTGDVDHVNISAAGCTVAMPPDTVDIRPGISSSVAGEAMDNVTAAEYSADPRILAGYPEARNVAPTGADAVFSTNKRGTVYWAITALADGSVSEDDLITPPVYGGIILQSGTLQAAASKTEYTAKLNKLTTDGSYYLSAIMVDSRGQHSPVKVTAFTTPDDTVPAFTTGYPVMSKVTCAVSQVTVMTNKSCQLYYALLPKGSATPRAEDFKSNAITGNLGYGSIDVVKNSTLPFRVNNVDLEEKTDYDLYLWLNDYDNVKSSAVRKLSFTTADETPPTITYMEQTNAQTTSIDMTYALDEPGTLYWAIVREGDPFFRPMTGTNFTPTLEDEAGKIQIEAGVGAVKKGSSNAANADADIRFAISGLPAQSDANPQTTYDLYYVAKDRAGNYSEAKRITVSIADGLPPKVTQEFTRYNGDEVDKPLANTDVRLVFSENAQGVKTVRGQRVYEEKFLELYNDSQDQDKTAEEREQARVQLGDALKNHIKFYYKENGRFLDSETEGLQRDAKGQGPDNWLIDFYNATVQLEGGKMIITFPTDRNKERSALNLSSGGTYQFRVSEIVDYAIIPNMMGATSLPEFTTVFATVTISSANEWELTDGGKTLPIDMCFQLDPLSTSSTTEDVFYDLMIWSDSSMEFELYTRETTTNGRAFGAWRDVGTFTYTVPQGDPYAYRTVAQIERGTGSSYPFKPLLDLKEGTQYQYAIHVTRLDGNADRNAWNKIVNMKVTIAAGSQSLLRLVPAGSREEDWANAKASGVYSVGEPDPYTQKVPFSDTRAPDIVAPYPRFEVGDSVADMTFLLNREGTIYYVVTPVREITDNGKPDIDTPVQATAIELIKDPNGNITGTTNDHTPLPAEVPESGNDNAQGVTNPMYLSQPTRETIINTRITDTRVRQGNVRGNAGTTSSVHLVDLIPDTIYYVYLMFQGTQQVVSDYALCYKFRTAEGIRPIIQLQVVNNSDVDVTVDRTAEVYAKLLYAGNVGSPFNEDFSGYIEKNEDGTPVNPKIPASYLAKGYTVLQAMIDSIGSTGTCSVFDEYASIATKNRVAAIIREGNLGDTIVDQWGPQTVEMKKHELMKFDKDRMDENNQYVCVAVAKSPLYEGDGFRAARPVQLVDTESPLITDVLVNLSYDATTGEMNGTVQIVFNKVLYLRVDDNSRYLLAKTMDFGPIKDPNDATKDSGYCGLGGRVIESNGVTVMVSKTLYQTNTLEFNFEKVKGTSYGISLPIGLCNRWGYNAGAGTVRVSINPQTGATSYTVTPSAWQAKG